MSQIPPVLLIVIGSTVLVISLFNLKLMLFGIVGAIFIVIGVVGLFKKKKKPVEKKNPVQQHQHTQHTHHARKACHACGYHMPYTYNFCPNCGHAMHHKRM